MPTPKPCIEPGCTYPKHLPYHRCGWHWLATQPIAVQVEAAEGRLAAATGPVRKRVPEKEWPQGCRWCAGCQSYVPLFYARGSRCKACASKGAHASHLRRTFGIDDELYQRLLTWQGGKCYMCGRTPRSRRLAVDHDHGCTAGHPPDQGCPDCVRGLLCSDDERGCNHAILGNVTGLPMARRIVLYLEKGPLQRMLDGEPAPQLTYRESKTPSPASGWATENEDPPY